MWYVMDWKHYAIVSVITALSSYVIGYATCKWEQAYKDAQEAGAVA